MTLGDSLTFGYSQQLFNENITNGENPSNFEHGFANDYLAKQSRSSTRRLIDLGCPGETSNSLIGNGPLGEALGESSEAPCAYHEVEGLPLHVSYGPAGTSQLEAALYQIGASAAEGKPVTTVTLDIGANDELHAIAAAEAEAYKHAEEAGEAAAYKYVVEAETPGTEAYKAAEAAGNAAGYAYVVEAETPGTEAYEAAEAAGAAAAEAYLTEVGTPGSGPNEEAWAVGLAAYYKALEEGKSEEEAALIGGEALEAFVYGKANEIGTKAGEEYVAEHAEAAGKAAAEAFVGREAEAIGKAAAEKYGAEHGVAEVKRWLEEHALPLFTHIVTNNLKIMGTLRESGYKGQIIAVGGYDPYGNLEGKGELLSGSLTLAKTLNAIEETKFAEAPYDACFANPQPEFNPGGKHEPGRLQEYTNMANTNVSNGKADGPDIHPTPAGYEAIAHIMKRDCGS
ncbi:MAG TPA: hypothetical protein VMA83_12740 [Solirubrobacteraceae bacterium]|nr:hypothetical protein [Solirubrobacteraceae bacterium]